MSAFATVVATARQPSHWIMSEGGLRGKDLNLRPLGYEPNELPDCSTPHSHPNKASAPQQPSLRTPCARLTVPDCRAGHTDTDPTRQPAGRSRRVSDPSFAAI